MNQLLHVVPDPWVLPVTILLWGLIAFFAVVLLVTFFAIIWGS